MSAVYRRYQDMALVIVAVVVVFGVYVGMAGGGQSSKEDADVLFLFDAPPGNAVLPFAALYTGNVSIPEVVGVSGRETSFDVVESFNTAEKPVVAEIEFNALGAVERPYRLLDIRHKTRLKEVFLVTRGNPNITAPVDVEDRSIALAEERIYGWLIRFLLEEEYEIDIADDQIWNADTHTALRLLNTGVVDVAQTFFFSSGYNVFREIMRAGSVFEERYGTAPPRRVFIASTDIAPEECSRVVSMLNRSVAFGMRHAEELVDSGSLAAGMNIGADITDSVFGGLVPGLGSLSDQDVQLLDRIGRFMEGKGYWEESVAVSEAHSRGSKAGCGQETGSDRAVRNEGR